MTEHRHIDDRKGCVEIAPDVCMRPTVHGGAAHITNADGSIAGGPDEHLAGFVIAFDIPGEEYRLEGGVMVDRHFAGQSPVWTMTGSLEGGDLTLSPSVRMSSGVPERERHGWVRNGKWEPA